MAARELTISIDFGTFGVFSCYTHPGTTDAFLIEGWPDMPDSTYKKNLSAILLRKSNPSEVLGFGYTARKIFTNPDEQARLSDMMYFENFKLALFQAGSVFSFEKPVYSQDGHSSVPLGHLVKLALNEIVVHSLKFYEQRKHRKLERNDVKWILTVPSIWPPMSREAMIRCGAEIDIAPSNILILTEPEAAACFVVKFMEDSGEPIVPNERFMCLDCGAGTYDLTCHMMAQDGTISEVFPQAGDLCGSVQVDQQFISILADVLGPRTFRLLKQTHTNYYHDELDHFQTNRMNAQPDDNLRRQPTNLEDFFDDAKLEDIDLRSLCASFSRRDGGLEEGCITYRRRKLNLTQDVVQYLHRDVLENMVNFLRGKCRRTPITKLFLVGGFGKSGYVQHAVKDMMNREFGGDVQIITPDMAELAVVKGAIHEAHRRSISSRRCQFTYGLAVDKAFDSAVDDPALRVEDPTFPGGFKIPGVFHVLMEQNEKRRAGERRGFSYPIMPGETEVAIDIMKSSDRFPSFIHEDTCSVAKRHVYRLPGPPFHRLRNLEVSFVFGEANFQLECQVDGRNEVQFDVEFAN